LPPTPRALDNAELLVSELAGQFGQPLGGLATPNEVFPNPNGRFELEWSVGDRKWGIEIGPDRTARYLMKFGRGGDTICSKGAIPASASAANHVLSAR
jgi:hypothetical protein